LDTPAPSEFISRSARFELRVNLSFQSGGEVWDGYTLNVSESGLLANFFEPLSIWQVGDLEIDLNGETLYIRARVAREEGRRYGLAFQVHDDSDRRTIRILLEGAGCIF
jgi:hypothetical protein